MILTAVVLAAMGVFLLLHGDALPQGRWSKAAATACGLAALWPIACWLAAVRRPDDGPALLADLPSKPGSVYLGRGYAWTPERARCLRDAAMAGQRPAPPESRDLYMPECELGRHALLLGTTGSGKTRSMELLIAQAIRRGDAVAVIDPKGDDRLLARVWDEALRAGRSPQLIALPYPKASVPYNPVARFAEVREVADRIAALLPAGGDAEPFRAFAWEVAHTTAAALRLAGEPITLVALKRYAIDEPWELVRRVIDPSLLRGRDPRRAAELAGRRAGPELRSLLSLVGRPADHTQKMTSALLPILSKLTAGSNRELLSPPRGGFEWDTLDVAFLYLGSLLGADSASAVARMALLDFQSYLGRRYAYGRAARPVSLFVDEVADVVSPAFIHVLSQSRGAGVRVTLAAQTLADLEAALGSPAHARQIAANVNTILQFRAQSVADAEAFAALVGERLLPATSEGETYEPSMFTSGFQSVEDFRAMFSRQREWRDQALVPPWAIMELPPFHFYARWGARVARGVAPLMPDPPHGACGGLEGSCSKRCWCGRCCWPSPRRSPGRPGRSATAFVSGSSGSARICG